MTARRTGIHILSNLKSSIKRMVPPESEVINNAKKMLSSFGDEDFMGLDE